MNRKISKISTMVFIVLLSSAISGGLAWAEVVSTDVTVTATDSEQEALQNIEANRDQVIADIVDLFAPQFENGDTSQLEGLLMHASASQLLAAQDAQNLDELYSILVGSASDGLDGVLALGDIDKDYTFTPITPCRIVDTSIAGGQLAPGVSRNYYVYGSLYSQGGTYCSSPVGEPRGVMLNITAVPRPGATGGNIVAYPRYSSTPNASIVNYKYGVQNIANAASIKTYYGSGEEITVLNRNGYVHLVIDVLGYYTNPSSPSTVNPTEIRYIDGDQLLSLTTTVTAVRELAVYTPKSSYCVINASGFLQFDGAGFDKGLCYISTSTSTGIDYNRTIYASDHGESVSSNMPLSGTRGIYKTAGTTTYTLMCKEVSGDVKVGDSILTAICTE